jgi:hypothetical protein
VQGSTGAAAAGVASVGAGTDAARGQGDGTVIAPPQGEEVREISA